MSFDRSRRGHHWTHEVRAAAASLPSLSDNVALWCTQKNRQYVMTQPTDAETGLLGAPRRMD